MPRKAKIGATRSSYVYRLRLPDDLRTQREAFAPRKIDNRLHTCGH
jgi:hypothetical protein